MEENNTAQQGSGGAPQPQALSVAEQSDVTVPADAGASQAGEGEKPSLSKRRSYKPSHKATFVGLAFVVLFLSANAAGLAFLMRSQANAEEQLINSGVTLSGETLEKLGVNREPIGEASVLTVGPDSTFRGDLTVGGNVSIGGNLQLNSSFIGSSARFTNLQAGDVQLEQLNVNGDGTMSNLNVRQDLIIDGTTRVQGQAVFSQLTTINNNLNVAGSVAIGGSLSVRTFEANNLTSGGLLTVGGHVVTRGGSPTVSQGNALGSAGTASISGTDTAGTIAVNVGTGPSAGLIANVSFNRPYSKIPRVVVSPVGGPMPGLYVNRTPNGFTVSTSTALSPGGYAIDFIVIQ